MYSNIKFNYGNVFLSVDPGDGSLIIQMRGGKKEVIPHNIAVELVAHIRSKQASFEENNRRSFFEVLTSKFNI